MIDVGDPRTVLRHLEGRARRRFGQHFLARPDLVDRMVAAAGVSEGDEVVEIGPGLGILTRALLAAGARLTCVEIDRDLAGWIREAFPAAALVEADATRLDWSTVVSGPGASLVANLPYNVGTGLLMDVLRQPGRFARATVMLQAEVVERLVATPRTKAYGALSVQAQARARLLAVVAVPPSAFLPPPKVRSLVVRADLYDTPRTGGIAPADFDRLVQAAFSHRRKTLRNALAGFVGRDRLPAVLERAGIDGGLRAEALDLDAFGALARAVFAPSDPDGV